MKNFFVAFALLFLAKSTTATEGMWIPMLLSANEAEMRSMGLKLTAEDIYSINKSSLKDAIVHFGGFCTGEIISGSGLVITNHHCGFGQIQKHTTVKNDYLKHGFWAMSKKEELTNPGLFVDFLKYMEEVTNDVLVGVHDDLSVAEREDIIAKNIKEIVAKKQKEADYIYNVRGFFNDNRYFLMAIQRYSDVRLVGAPPSSIGKYGSDTDNWMWPRHTGDFSVFRIYADKNNNPAEISTKNVPFVPAQFLSINIKPKKEGDFTMVFGYPGRTELYLPAVAVDQIVNVLTPVKINIRETRLKLLDGRMRQSDEMRIKYAATYASVSNAWKKWIGQNQGIKETHGIEKKREREEDFKNRLAENQEWNNQYTGILEEFDHLYSALQPYALARDYFIEAAYSGIEVVKYAARYRALVAAKDQPADVLQKRAESLVADMDAFYKDFDAEADAEGMAALLAIYVNQPGQQFLPDGWSNKTDVKAIAETILAKSIFMQANAAKTLSIMAKKDPVAFTNLVAADTAYALMNALFNAYNTKVAPSYNHINAEIQELQKLYTEAQVEVFSEKQSYPDANSTLRLTYGLVEGYQPEGAPKYDYITYMDGLMDKYKPGDYEFDLPQKLIELYNKKDFGRYGENGKMPVCFIASNHTSGGNSGSPALNGKGEFIGINFDRVWEGTMSDLYYDRSICRNIMVDSRYILFIIDKYAGAGYLLKEMKIVQ